MHHQQIDAWSLAMMQEVVARIDADPQRQGLQRARANAQRWNAQSPSPAIQEWVELLKLSWEELRPLLLEVGDEGQRRRSSSPFCGILSPRERWDLLRRYRAD